ncbi:unnamed protein product [Pipistrellus nathusii]|uniref:Secreted protein n=1 Tax=Pipistrellus nathusii TaxID=59473 RepID=A0ABP0A444_PIPNA
MLGILPLSWLNAISHLFHILPVFCAFPPPPLNEKNLEFLSIFQCLAFRDAYSFLKSHVAPVCLEHRDFLLVVRWQFLSKGLYSWFPSWASGLAGAISPARSSALWFPYSSGELLLQPEDVGSPGPPPHT